MTFGLLILVYVEVYWGSQVSSKWWAFLSVKATFLIKNALSKKEIGSQIIIENVYLKNQKEVKTPSDIRSGDFPSPVKEKSRIWLKIFI